MIFNIYLLQHIRYGRDGWRFGGSRVGDLVVQGCAMVIHITQFDGDKYIAKVELLSNNNQKIKLFEYMKY